MKDQTLQQKSQRILCIVFPDRHITARTLRNISSTLAFWMAHNGILPQGVSKEEFLQNFATSQGHDVATMDAHYNKYSSVEDFHNIMNHTIDTVYAAPSSHSANISLELSSDINRIIASMEQVSTYETVTISTEEDLQPGTNRVSFIF